MVLQTNQKAQIGLACLLLLLPTHFIICDVIGLYTILNAILFVASIAIIVVTLAPMFTEELNQKFDKI